MAQRQKKPKFIRKDGRIIPIGVDKDKRSRSAQRTPDPKRSRAIKKGIRKKERESKIKTGLGLIAASLGLQGVGQALAGKTFRAGAQVGERAQQFTSSAQLALFEDSDPRFRPLGLRFLERAGLEAKKTAKILKVSRGLFKITPLAATGIASVGVERILEGLGQDDDSFKTEAASIAVGSSVTALGSAAFRAGAGRRLIRRLQNR